MSSRVGAFHPAEIETEVEGFWQTVHQLEKTFADITTVKLLILKVTTLVMHHVRVT
jgi:glycine cleavage system protein P-like pyridoxal-binding family